MCWVFSIEALPWSDPKDLPGARGYEFKPLIADDPICANALSCKFGRLDPVDPSVPHTELWNRALYFLNGSGEIGIDGDTRPVREDSLAEVKAGERHLLREFRPGEMRNLAVNDPPHLAVNDPPHRRN